MSLETDIRAAFVAVAGDAIANLASAVTKESGGYRLIFTGFHKDGTEYAVTSPLASDPVAMATQMAQGVITTHTGVNHMGAPAPMKTLGDTLRKSLTAATERATKLAQSAQAEVANYHTVLDQAESVVADVKTAAADVQSALGLSTNGGPAGPLAS